MILSSPFPCRSCREFVSCRRSRVASCLVSFRFWIPCRCWAWKLWLDPVCRSRCDSRVDSIGVVERSSRIEGFVAHFPVWKVSTVAMVVPRLELQGESDCSDSSRIVLLKVLVVFRLIFVIDCVVWPVQW